MTLEDFAEGGGATDAGPEDRAKHELTQWLEDDGAEVWWEKANPWNYPTFRTDSTDRPDLLVCAESGLTVAIEAKHDNSGVYRAPPQLQRYWEKYIEGDESYRAAGERVDPDVFVIANGHSPEGRLYDPEYNDDVLQTWESWGGSKHPRKHGWLPQVEYNATKATVRVQWQFAAAYLNGLDRNPGVGIGVLLSSTLDGDESGEPRLLYYLDGEEHWESLR